MRLVDANVLLYAVNEGAVQHARARDWLNAALSGLETVGFSWSVLLAFLRVATRPVVLPRPLPVEVAIVIAQGWLAQPPSVIVEPGPRHLDRLGGLLAPSGTGGNLVVDGHLAALALEHDATVVSFDRDFGRFVGVRLEVP